MNLNIILLTYNNLNSTKKCIEKLYSHTKNFNLVIVDNNSDNDTIKFLQSLKYKNLTIHFNDFNNGTIEGRNQGYFIAEHMYPNYDLIFFIDNDQFVQPNWQNSYYSLFEQGYDLVGCEAWKMKNNFYPYKRITNKNDTFSYVGGGGMMIRNKVIKDIGLLDETYRKVYFEDPDLCFRAHEKIYRIGWNYHPVIIHQKHNLALKGERKTLFMKNWKKFQLKWEGHKLPNLRMI